jgi:hypothetical protein
MNIKFIVNGDPTYIKVTESQTLQKSVIDALIKSQYMDRPYKEWYAKKEDGTMLPLDKTIKDLSITEDIIIYLWRKIGENA